MDNQDMSTLNKRTRVGAAVAAVATAASIFALAAPASAAPVPPLPPTNVKATIVAGTNDLKVDWDANAAGEPATYYVVNFWSIPRVDDAFGIPVDLVQVAVPAPTTEYVWTDAPAGKLIRSSVSAVNAYGSTFDVVADVDVLIPPDTAPVPPTPPVATNPERPFALGAWNDVITRTYKEFVGRTPKLDELTFWRFFITQGTPNAATLEARRLEFVANLAEDAEQTDGPAIRLYTAYFGRTPDTGGVKFWSKKLRSGSTLLNVSDFFSTSSEFKNTYGDIDEAEFVALIYRNVLNRNPDGTGFSFWTRQLQSGRYSRAEVMIGFSESSEFKTKNIARVGTTIAYLHMLNRVPTQGEYFLADNIFGSLPTTPIGFVPPPSNTHPFDMFYGVLYWRILDSVEYRALGTTP
jgi:hypothetical protein